MTGSDIEEQISPEEDDQLSPSSQPKTGLARWRFALKNSYDGFVYCVKTEAAVREELIALVLSVPLAILLVDNTTHRIAMVLSVLFVLIVELLNSAVETAIDRISLERHPLSKASKDIGSLAVSLAIVFSLIIWFASIYAQYFP